MSLEAERKLTIILPCSVFPIIFDNFPLIVETPKPIPSDHAPADEKLYKIKKLKYCFFFLLDLASQSSSGEMSKTPECY